MANLLTRRLEGLGPLSAEDRRLLDDVIRDDREVGPRDDLIKEGDDPDDVLLILEGFACRYKLTRDGKRQIAAYLVPGDFCNLHVFILKAMDHNIGTLSACRIVAIPRARILELTERPAIARALWWATLVDEAILREWLVSLGRRDAAQRLAHILCELLHRLRAVGLAKGSSYELPLTQVDLADTLGLSTVHLNRSLQALRNEGLITLKDKHVVILHPTRLTELAGFNPNYLHLGGGEEDKPRPRRAAR
jgi:CRP-like cAMP-binding protein